MKTDILPHGARTAAPSDRLVAVGAAASYCWGAILERIGQPAEAQTLYEGLLARNGLDGLQRALAGRNLAVLLAREGGSPKALELIDAAIAELGPSSELLDARGVITLRLADVGGAVADCEEASIGPFAVRLLHLAPPPQG